MADELQAELWMRAVAGFEPSGLCVAPDGRSIYVVGDESHLATVPLNTGVPRIRSVKPRADLEGVGVGPQGRIFVLAERRSQLWRVEDRRRVSKWRIRPRGSKNKGYEGMVIVPGEEPRLLLSLQGGKRSMLRGFGLPEHDEAPLELLTEAKLPWPDVAGLCWHGGALYALSDGARVLARLREDRGEWKVEATWRTPARDLEGVAIFAGHVYLAQDSGGIWRGQWPTSGAPPRPGPSVEVRVRAEGGPVAL